MPSDSAVSVRPAVPADAGRLFDWRNDPVTRAMSRSTDPVAWDDHERWLATALADPQRRLMIGEADGRPVGSVRFDLGAKDAEVSITLAPEARGKGLSGPLLRAAIAAFRQASALPVRAEIRPDNLASRRLFEAAGFERADGTGAILHYRLP